MSGICDTCSLNKGCRKPIGGVDSCRRYVKAKESNYKCLFGTPERAARTLHDVCANCRYGNCNDCCLPDWIDFGDYDALLEWLKGDA